MIRIHCSYHKCLTVYFSRVMHGVFILGGYKHFESRLNDFKNLHRNYKLASINNHVLDLKHLSHKTRISRFIRDPRDLVVSGYFYHKRGAEAWCRLKNPNQKVLSRVNGSIPNAINYNESIAECLQRLSLEEGLIAEIDFRANHFKSMMSWPLNDPRISLFRYEEFIGNEKAVIAKICDHLKLGLIRKIIALWVAQKYAAKNHLLKLVHIRNPEPNQWEKYFTDNVYEYFNSKYKSLIQRYNY